MAISPPTVAMRLRQRAAERRPSLLCAERDQLLGGVVPYFSRCGAASRRGGLLALIVPLRRFALADGQCHSIGDQAAG
jgi:hypothetical protein